MRATDTPESRSVRMPIRTYSIANERLHWRTRAKRAKVQRSAARMLCPADLVLPLTIRIVRVSPRELDSDNLAISAKHVRDGIADRLGIDDRDPRVTWVYAQARGYDFSVLVEFASA